MRRCRLDGLLSRLAAMHEARGTEARNANRVGLFSFQKEHEPGEPRLTPSESRAVECLFATSVFGQTTAPRSSPRRRGSRHTSASAIAFFLFRKEKESKRNCYRKSARPKGRLLVIYFSLWTNPKRKVAKEKDLVRMRGLEPPRVAPLPPQSSVSTSSTTSAP